MAIFAKIKQNVFTIREKCSVEIVVTSTSDLLSGDLVEIQFPNSWSLIYGPSFTRDFQTEDCQKEHYLRVSTETSLKAEFDIQINKRHLYFHEGTVRHGRHICAKLKKGIIPAYTPINVCYMNTFAPYVAETEYVWIRVNGQAPEVEPALTVLPGPAEHVRIIVPSGTRAGEEFDVLISTLDKFDNCSSTFHENKTLKIVKLTVGGESGADDTSTSLNDDSEIIRYGTTEDKIAAEGFDFNGSIKIPVKIQKHGAYRFTMDGIQSNAIIISESNSGPYWGDIHIHTGISHDAQGNDPYSYARNVSGLDFAGITDHWDSIGVDGYKKLEEWAEEHNIPGKFVTILGDERNPAILGGHHNMYFRDIKSFREYAALPGTKYSESIGDTKNLVQEFDNTRVMIIPHHTGISFGDWDQVNKIRGCTVNFPAINDNSLRPVVEIYSHHGQSEQYSPQHILSYEFNRMRNPEHRANTSVPGNYYVQNFWISGKKLGVIASSDEHSGQGGRRHGGITAVWSDELTRGGVFDAIKGRSCYATTGERILINFSIDKISMGNCGIVKKGEKVRIDCKVWGTETLLRIELLRYRFGLDAEFIPIASYSPRPETLDYSFQIEDEIQHNCMYYMRVVQEPLEWPGMAWSSPIWLDVE